MSHAWALTWPALPCPALRRRATEQLAERGGARGGERRYCRGDRSIVEVSWGHMSDSSPAYDIGGIGDVGIVSFVFHFHLFVGTDHRERTIIDMCQYA